MDNQPAQPKNLITPAKFHLNPTHRMFFICIAVLLIGFFLGFMTWSILPFGKSSMPVISPSPQPTKTESKLPISIDLLQNPIISEWRGSVKGKITQKDEHTFTLVDEKGNSITITDIMPNGTVFKTLFYNPGYGEKKRLTLKDMSLGSILRGNFFIFKEGPNTPVGGAFTKE